jgi:hypothetical protein
MDAQLDRIRNKTMGLYDGTHHYTMKHTTGSFERFIRPTAREENQLKQEKEEGERNGTKEKETEREK